jgi:branched-chain amino acid transport system ATP-binding protein
LKHTLARESLLSVQGLDVYYGETHVLWDVSLDMPGGAITACIGANGAGKSTLLKAIVGLQAAKKGRIFFSGEEIEGLPTEERVRRGITLVPEGRGLLAAMTVEENLILGAYPSRARKKTEDSLNVTYSRIPILKERRKQFAGTLSGGEQQKLVIGRALMSDPRLLILDEPSLGLSPIAVSEVYQLIDNVHKTGVSILIVEQNVRVALEKSSVAYVMENGRIVNSGPSSELLVEEELRKSYLGVV